MRQDVLVWTGWCHGMSLVSFGSILKLNLPIRVCLYIPIGQSGPKSSWANVLFARLLFKKIKTMSQTMLQGALTSPHVHLQTKKL